MNVQGYLHRVSLTHSPLILATDSKTPLGSDLLLTMLPTNDFWQSNNLFCIQEHRMLGKLQDSFDSHNCGESHLLPTQNTPSLAPLPQTPDQLSGKLTNIDIA